MSDDFSIFKTFTVLEQAKEVKEILEKNGIKTIVADNVPSVDSNFGANPLNNRIEIRIHQSSFKKASEILEQRATKLIENIDPDYYLLSFSNDELYDVILKSDEWSEFDYSLAKKLLNERGKDVSDDIIKSLQQKRLNELARPEGNQKPWIVAGYIFAFFGGLLGFVIGYSLWTQKKTLPNGQKVFSYYPEDRKHGKYIFYLGLIMLPINILVAVFLF